MQKNKEEKIKEFVKRVLVLVAESLSIDKDQVLDADRAFPKGQLRGDVIVVAPKQVRDWKIEDIRVLIEAKKKDRILSDLVDGTKGLRHDGKKGLLQLFDEALQSLINAKPGTVLYCGVTDGTNWILGKAVAQEFEQVVRRLLKRNKELHAGERPEMRLSLATKTYSMAKNEDAKELFEALRYFLSAQFKLLASADVIDEPSFDRKSEVSSLFLLSS